MMLKLEGELRELLKKHAGQELTMQELIDGVYGGTDDRTERDRVRQQIKRMLDLMIDAREVKRVEVHARKHTYVWRKKK